MADAKKKFFKTGALVYIESEEESDEVFVLEEGSVELIAGRGVRRLRPTVGPGEIFGFTSCLCRRPRMETAEARSDSTVVAFDRARFIELVQSNPELATKIISYFAEELRGYDELMLSPSAGADFTADESRLFTLGELFRARGRPTHALHAFLVYGKHFPAGAHAAAARSASAELARHVPPPRPPSGPARLYADGEMIFCEHEPGDELYIIKSGKVEITKTTPAEEILLSVLREGDIFGELSIVSRKPRSASAVAAGEVALIPITRESLPAVFERSPATIARILIAVSQRIWFTFIRLQSRLYENPLTRAYVLLENKLLEERVSLSSTHPAVLPLGMADLLGMAGVPAVQQEGVKADLSDDPNLAFQFRQLTIESPSVLATKAGYHRTRDRLESHGMERHPRPPRKKTPPPERMGLDPQELRVPPESMP